MTTTIRKATPDDAELLQELILELAAYERLLDEAEPDIPLLREHLSEEALTGCEALIAETESGTAVGFALFYHTYSTFLTNAGLYVEDLYVKTTYRGEGIGRALLARLAELAEERGCRRMEWAVLDWNTEAIEFYDEMGAEPLDDWTLMRLDEEAIEEVAALAGEGVA
jgi:diamine N-acetyltransferase